VITGFVPINQQGTLPCLLCKPLSAYTPLICLTEVFPDQEKPFPGPQAGTNIIVYRITFNLTKG